MSENRIISEKWENVVVTRIGLAMYICAGTGTAVHWDRPFHGFVLNDENAVKDYCFSDGTVLRTKGGDLFYLPKGSSYRVRTISSGGCYAINFDADMEDVPFAVAFRNRDTLRKIFKDAAKIWQGRLEYSHVFVMKSVYDILLQVRREEQRNYIPKDTARLLTPAVEKIRSDFAQNDISVAALAAACNISEVYFRRLFKNKFGISPKEYIISLRINYAEQLLESGMFAVGEVARLCGYAEVCHFTREFTKRVGVSPHVYKNRGRLSRTEGYDSSNSH